MEKCGRVGEATNDNMAHAHFTQGTEGYTHTHTHSDCVIRLHERTSMLRYTYMVSLAFTVVNLPNCRHRYEFLAVMGCFLSTSRPARPFGCPVESVWPAVRFVK